MEIKKVLVLIPEHYWDMDQQDMCGEGNENVISQTEKGYECSYIPYTMHWNWRQEKNTFWWNSKDKNQELLKYISSLCSFRNKIENQESF